MKKKLSDLHSVALDNNGALAQNFNEVQNHMKRNISKLMGRKKWINCMAFRSLKLIVSDLNL